MDSSHLGEAAPNSTDDNQAEQPQYSLGQILGIWALATLPMTVLAFVVAPLARKVLDIPPETPDFLVFWPFMILGLVWQFVLSLIIVRREEGDIRWGTIRRRMWYVRPRHPKTGRPSYRLLWWAAPFIALSLIFQFIPLPNPTADLFPFIKNLPHYNLQEVLSPAFRGAWRLLVLTLLTLPFNYFLGEEFLFRGILLPRMRGVFGRADWFFNGVFFAFYHLHKPAGILQGAILSGFIFSFPARRFRSNWLAVMIHGIEAVIALILVLGVVLGRP